VYPLQSSCASTVNTAWVDIHTRLSQHWNALQAPGIKAYLGSEKRHPWPEGDLGERYVRNVQTVLRG